MHNLLLIYIQFPLKWFAICKYLTTTKYVSIAESQARLKLKKNNFCQTKFICQLLNALNFLSNLIRYEKIFFC